MSSLIMVLMEMDMILLKYILAAQAVLQIFSSFAWAQNGFPQAAADFPTLPKCFSTD